MFICKLSRKKSKTLLCQCRSGGLLYQKSYEDVVIKLVSSVNVVRGGKRQKFNFLKDRHEVGKFGTVYATRNHETSQEQLNRSDRLSPCILQAKTFTQLGWTGLHGFFCRSGSYNCQHVYEDESKNFFRKVFDSFGFCYLYISLIVSILA